MAAVATPTSCRSMANALRTYNPQGLPMPPYAADAARLDVIAAEIEAASIPPPPPPPGPVLPDFFRLTKRRYDAAVSVGGIGKPFGQAVTYAWPKGGNKLNPDGSLKELHVRVWEFEAPTGGPHKQLVQINPGTDQITCISETPGDFVQGIRDNTGRIVSRLNGGNVNMQWTTKPGPGLVLVPGRTYYINVAHFDLDELVNHGRYVSSAGCASPPCANVWVLWACHPMLAA